MTPAENTSTNTTEKKVDTKDLIKVIELLEGSSGKSEKTESLNDMIGQDVIIRTYSAGVHFGVLEQKSGNEVILRNARRMYQWWAKKSISLSGVAVYGVNQGKSKICPAVDRIWLEAIEILPCTDIAAESIEGCEDVEAS